MRAGGLGGSGGGERGGGAVLLLCWQPKREGVGEGEKSSLSVGLPRCLELQHPSSSSNNQHFQLLLTDKCDEE